MEVNNMLFMMIFTVLAGMYVFVFGFLRIANEWFYVNKLGEKRHSLPPGDMGWPLIGKMWSFLRAFRCRDPDSFLSCFVSRYGSTGIYRTLLFGEPSIMVCTPELCKRVLVDEQNFKMSYPDSTKRLQGRKSFHNMSNEDHKLLRHVTAARINGSERLSTYIDRIENVMVESLEKWAGEGRAIEFAEEMKKPSFKAILPIFYGCNDDSFIERTMKLFSTINKGFNSLAINIPGFAYHAAMKAKREVEEILQEVLDARKAMTRTDNISESGRDMLDILMEVNYDDGRKLGDLEINDIIHVYLLAGYESTAMATMWTLVYLHEHPEILQKAKDEQLQILKRRDPSQKGISYREIKQMEYLATVINEMLRRVNLGFAFFREANKDVTLNGYLVPKGWKVMVCTRAVHLDPQNYLDPKEFNPSRWENAKRKGGPFIPFGAGSRICPGSDLAKLEICIFMHHFLLDYELKWINPKCPINYLPVPKPSDNFLVKIKKLNKVM